MIIWSISGEECVVGVECSGWMCIGHKCQVRRFALMPECIACDEKDDRLQKQTSQSSKREYLRVNKFALLISTLFVPLFLSLDPAMQVSTQSLPLRKRRRVVMCACFAIENYDFFLVCCELCLQSNADLIIDFLEWRQTMRGSDQDQFHLPLTMTNCNAFFGCHLSSVFYLCRWHNGIWSMDETINWTVNLFSSNRPIAFDVLKQTPFSFL